MEIHWSSRGGWQNNRPSPPHEKYKFVENVFEELDAPGEWYLDRKEHILYLYPEQGTDLAAARLEAGGLEELVKIQGGRLIPRRERDAPGFGADWNAANLHGKPGAPAEK